MRPAQVASAAWALLGAFGTAEARRRLQILAYAQPSCSSSHQYALRRVAAALARRGHNVTLVEPRHAARLGDSLEEGVTVLPVDILKDEEYDRRFKSGESYQRLSQEVVAELLPQVLHRLKKVAFDVAVVDAIYPVIAKELRLPTVHVQCFGDPDAMSSIWFHYGMSAGSGFRAKLRHAQFAVLWWLSWLAVGSHQDGGGHGPDGISWATYFEEYTLALMLQGTARFTLPAAGASLAALHPTRVVLVGSLTARPQAEFPAEAASFPDRGLALVAFGTHPLPCPHGILNALAEVGLSAIILVNSCRSSGNLSESHILPASRDQGAWLRVHGMQLAVVHGGIHSLHEAIAAQLPIACVPQQGDQYVNCRDIQRQRLGWAMHRHATAEEAAPVFRMLLQGGFTDPQAAQLLRTSGGPSAVVDYVDGLAEVMEEEGKDWFRRRPPLQPFFASPFRHAEAWILVAALCLLLSAVLCCLLPLVLVDSTTKED